MIQLGRCQPGASMTIGDIAEQEGLSVANVRKLMMILREAGLVRSVRGRSGGYVLAAQAEKIPVGRILESLGGRLFDKGFCDRFVGTTGDCANSLSCTLRSLWAILDSVVGGVLHQMTLAELAGDARSVKIALHNHLEASMNQTIRKEGAGIPLERVSKTLSH